ncbi:ArsR/SmtB family transcription factor [Salinibacterium hongtaonis]|uniref:ArsR/SmtB family transcription factor n=1 Tax=Homoserinimonas hongtaonis TaxID=2079791 RepID=UPI000D3CCA2D|nr:metalloregulator ArsR/SmtB family transcription factor [Salinibacterium hongtaonis]AWB88196.1 transcriptional regulator [Salinibacterium hongtaonis]
MAGQANLDQVFGALADPTRRRILSILRDGDATVAELAAPFSISQPAVSRHLKVLENAGLIARQRAGTARLSELTAAPLRDAAHWIVAFEEFWPGSADRQEESLLENFLTDDEWII